LFSKPNSAGRAFEKDLLKFDNANIGRRRADGK